MARTPKPPAAPGSRPRAAKPPLKPLDEHLAQLLNPALSRARAGGFAETPQASYQPGAEPLSRKRSQTSEPAHYAEIAAAKPRRVAQGNVVALPEDHRMGGGLDGLCEADALSTQGVKATHEALQALLEGGNPFFRDETVWLPHRPERPAKSEGGKSFRMQAPFEPRGDQPQAIATLVQGIGGGSATKFCSG